MAGKRDMVVLGASAGGVEAVKHVVSMLPSNLPAALFVAIHVSPWAKSHLPHILDHNGSLPAHHPVSGQKIEPGNIYVAPPDQHMLIDDGHLRLWHGPKENMHRPAVNTLFRSAAVHL